MLIKNALLCPGAIFFGGRSAYTALTAYLLLAGCTFGLTAVLIITNEEALKEALYTYLFPQSWHWLADKLAGFFFEAQTRLVLASFIISGAIMLASVILFPIKEWCSQAFEKHQNPHAVFKEFPLWMQALEEGKLLTLYIAAQGVVFAIGYYPYAWCKVVSSVLGTAILFFTFGLDFIAPSLQRQRVRYVDIVHTLLKNASATLLFGALFSAPLLLIGHWALSSTQLSLMQVSALLFTLNILSMAWAIPAGTQVGMHLRQSKQVAPPLQTNTTKMAYAGVMVTAALVTFFHATVALSLHHKSQILKCHYALDWSSFNRGFSSFKNVLLGKEPAKLSFDLTVHNPTAFDVVIEHSTVSVWQNHALISTSHLAPITIASNSTATQQILLDTQININNLSHWQSLAQGWQVFLEFDVLPGIPFKLALL